MIEQESYDIGDYVLDVNGKTWYISALDMIDLPGDSIAGKLEPDESPKFEYNVGHCINYGMDKDGFWDSAEKHCPKAVSQFKRWIDYYKVESGYLDVIPNHRFHELPFDLQTGVMIRFFQEKGTFFHTEHYSREQILESIVWSIMNFEVELRNNFNCKRCKK